MSKEQTRIESQDTANKLHTDIFKVKDTVNRALLPLQAFQYILDGANVDGAECSHVDVATVIEVLTEYAKQKIEEHIDILLEEYPAAEEQEPQRCKIDPLTDPLEFRDMKLDQIHEDDLQLLHEVITLGTEKGRKDLMVFVNGYHRSMVQRLKAEGKLDEKSEPAGEEVQSCL
jgi:hypothetical protein